MSDSADETLDTSTEETTSEETEVTETPITLNVEDGTCVSGANSYCTVDFADSYMAQRNRTSWADLTDNQKKSSLILGTDFVDHYFKWVGRRKFRNQELAFPRIDIIDDDGYEVRDIPLNLKKAICEAAYIVATNNAAAGDGDSSGLFITKDSNGDIKRKKVDVLEVEYFDSSSEEVAAEEFESIYDVLNSLLYGLYKTESDRNTVNVGAVWLG